MLGIVEVCCVVATEMFALSEDHKPTASKELQRIESAGGFVSAAGRINGNLNLSRSLGDMKYKQVPKLLPAEQIITAEPDITVTEILPDDQFLCWHVMAYGMPATKKFVTSSVSDYAMEWTSRPSRRKCSNTA